VGEYYDKAVSGADRIDQRPGFTEMLQQLATDSAKTIIVESSDRFARDLAVQLAGHDMLRGLGIAIIPASAPDFFTEDTPTAVLVRQVLGVKKRGVGMVVGAPSRCTRLHSCQRRIGLELGGRGSVAEA
jgi:DNA invertase Pin-like site-specific DNA recombinase